MSDQVNEIISPSLAERTAKAKELCVQLNDLVIKFSELGFDANKCIDVKALDKEIKSYIINE
jgi:hypothetical protein